MSQNLTMQRFVTFCCLAAFLSAWGCGSRTHSLDDFAGTWQMKISNVTPGDRALGAVEMAEHMTLQLRSDGTYDLGTGFESPSDEKCTWKIDGDQIILTNVATHWYTGKPETIRQTLHINSRDNLSFPPGPKGRQGWFVRCKKK